MKKKIEYLKIGKYKIFYSVIVKDVKHTYLKLTPNLHLKIILPYKSKLNIDSILNTSHQWLEKKIEVFTNSIKIVDNNKILYKGKSFNIKVYFVNESYEEVKLYKNTVFIYENFYRKKEEIIQDFMANHTLNYVSLKAKEFADDLDVAYRRIFIKDMKMWGRCTKDGYLLFDWKLIGLPERLIDFIVLHEIIHLKYFNHSKHFKRLLAKYFIDYKELDKKLEYFY